MSELIWSNISWIVKYNQKSADGFQKLDNGQNTGFIKRDLLSKLRLEIDGDAATHVYTVKAGYGNEVSDASYLGLTKSDFEEDHLERYLASSGDQMKWEHGQLHVSYNPQFYGGDELLIDFYQNQFTRAWDKISSFSSSDINLRDLILYDTETDKSYIDILKGDENSVAADGSDQIIKLTLTDLISLGEYSLEQPIKYSRNQK